ncbi:hypothetical protein A3J15_02455 [Candidatus Roizmanbacteria bacterium RIFCSPLOWO2_02_FULL_38_10]|uniref:Uncharacterized protein n=1 Tax=Candidatus Roizmanbacteria bacterium RIFCSPLOWO2_02_FULL_38_10 TaxID=1802074 RepID=A0A1F7JNF5_9BACT|nr:MAG: hypothetical protein A3J15_02455 [Candidatus Roizmanbacteria bacterium RIFCSPLOWO2_02_FULL_38_10]
MTLERSKPRQGREPTEITMIRGRMETDMELAHGTLAFLHKDPESRMPVFTPRTPIVAVDIAALAEDKRNAASAALSNLKLALSYLLSPSTKFKTRGGKSKLPIYARDMMQLAAYLGTLCYDTMPHIDIPLRISPDGVLTPVMTTKLHTESRLQQYPTSQDFGYARYAAAQWDLPTIDGLTDASSFDLTLYPPFPDSKPRTSRNIKFSKKEIQGMLGQTA